MSVKKVYGKPPAALWLSAVCAFFGLLSAAKGSDSVPPAVGLVSNNGFCPGGTWVDAVWPGGRKPEGLETWGSYCISGDKDVGRAETQEFLAPAALNLYLAGYPGTPGCRLALKNIQSGEESELRPHSTGDDWHFDSLPVPADWVGKPVRVIAEDTTTGHQGWFAFSPPFVPASSLLPAIDSTAPQSGFCPDGAYGATKWPGGVRPGGVVTWGSFCKDGDATTGWAASQPVAADAYIAAYVAGYPASPDIRLMVENLQTGRQILLQMATAPMELWRLYRFRLPEEWRGQSVRIIARDQSTKPGGWIAFSEPVKVSSGEARLAARTVLDFLELFAILMLPVVAACLLAVMRGVEDSLDLTTVAFLALGVVGYAAFWIYFFSRIAGMLFSYGGLLGSIAVIAYFGVEKSRRVKFRALRPLVAPGALVLFASLFIVSLGLLYGGEEHPLIIAGGRFGLPGPPTLAGDNSIPKMFADAVFAGHIPRPLGGDWLSSDRPPLQTGNTLWTYAWNIGIRDLQYQLLGVILQCSFLAALWAFLAACRIDHRALALSITMVFFTGFTFVNSFFVWPKLLAAAFLMVAIAYLLTDCYHPVRDRVVTGAMVGAAVAFALLSHGGAVFSVLGIGAWMLLRRRMPGRRFLIAMAGAVVVLYLPWVLYQRFYDPPGDHLMKTHLAGTTGPHPEISFTGLLISRYRSLTASEWLRLKISNFKTLGGDLPQYADDAETFGASVFTGPVVRRDNAAGALQRAMFLYWVPSLGVAILGPLALLPAWRSREGRAEYRAGWEMWWLTAVTMALWCVVMFGPDATSPRQGSYLTEVLALSGSCLAFWAVRPWVAAVMTGAQMVCNFALFVWLTPVMPPVGAEVATANWFLGAACLVSAAGMGAVLLNFAMGTASRMTGRALHGSSSQ